MFKTNIKGWAHPCHPSSPSALTMLRFSLCVHRYVIERHLCCSVLTGFQRGWNHQASSSLTASSGLERIGCESCFYLYIRHIWYEMTGYRNLCFDSHNNLLCINIDDRRSEDSDCFKINNDFDWRVSFENVFCTDEDISENHIGFYVTITTFAAELSLSLRFLMVTLSQKRPDFLFSSSKYILVERWCLIQCVNSATTFQKNYTLSFTSLSHLPVEGHLFKPSQL